MQSIRRRDMLRDKRLNELEDPHPFAPMQAMGDPKQGVGGHVPVPDFHCMTNSIRRFARHHTHTHHLFTGSIVLPICTLISHSPPLTTEQTTPSFF